MKKDIRNYKKGGEQYAYILDSIVVYDDNDNEIEATDYEKVRYFFNSFYNEFNYDYVKKLYPCISTRIGQYLRGIPSCINIHYCDYDIINIGKKWGYCQTIANERKFVKMWFDYIGSKLVSLKKHFEIE